MEPISVNNMVADARTRMKGLSMEETQHEFKLGDAVIVDVRERWREGAIPGVKHVPCGMLEFWADSQSEYHKRSMDLQKRTIVYCAGGLRSSLAADVLPKMGYQNVAHLEMSYDAWKKACGAHEEVPIPDEFRKR